jgi:hypothetical protein
MRILLIASAYNSMTQRLHAELADRGHDVSVELALGDEVMRDAVRRFDPDLVIAPPTGRGSRHPGCGEAPAGRQSLPLLLYRGGYPQ